MLTDFFRINLPYGIAKNKNGEWAAFNREYAPLGFNQKVNGFDINEGSIDFPIYTKYKSIPEKTLLKLASTDSAIRRDSEGKINAVWFYDDRSNPMNGENGWTEYFDKIKLIAKFSREL